ncbi:MAG TPA: hypothetical protein VFZ18_12410 [Longimicrobiaceae bacterium]
MRSTSLPLALLLGVAACDPGGVVVRGSFAGDGGRCTEAPASEVRAAGTGETAAVRDCAFRLVVRDSGSLQLEFRDAGDDVARMYLDEVPGRARMRLERIAFDDRRLAFPAAVSLKGAQLVEINGLRVSDPGDLPRSLDVEGTLLAVAATQRLLLVRPRDRWRPDLRVQLAAAGEVVTTRNRPGSIADLEFGDSVRVQGGTRDGLVIASRIVVPSDPSEAQEREERPGIWEEIGKILDDIGL